MKQITLKQHDVMNDLMSTTAFDANCFIEAYDGPTTDGASGQKSIIMLEPLQACELGRFLLSHYAPGELA